MKANSKYYILEGKIPKPVEMMEWAMWYEKNDKAVDRTILPNGVNVSTVFLGLDHSWEEDKVLLFETMIFGGEHDEYCERYSTWEEAEAGHKKAIEMVFAL